MLGKDQLVPLVTAAKSGDSEAFNTLFNEYYNDVYYFALKTVKNEDLACDITQETFMEIFNTLSDLHEPAAFVSWMRRITYHQCTRYFKKRKDVLVDDPEEGASMFENIPEDSAEFIPDESLDKKEFRQTILAMIDELSEEQRSAVVMYYFDNLSVKQIAQIQDTSEGTVKSRLNYARKAIKASVESYEKKHNIKLHALPFVPFMAWLFAGEQAVTSLSAASAQIVASTVSAATGTTVAVAEAATTQAAVSAVTTASAKAGVPLVGKIVAGVTATAVVAGGAAAVVVLTQNHGPDHPLYESTVLDTYYEQYTLQQSMQDYTDNSLYYVTEDGRAFSMHGEELSVGKNAQDVGVLQNNWYYLDELGFLHIQDFVFDELLIGQPVCALHEFSGEEYHTVFTMDQDGGLYVHEVAKGGRTNIPVKIVDSVTGETFDRVDTIDGYEAILFNSITVSVEGRIYWDAVTQVEMAENDIAYLTLEALEGVDRVLAHGEETSFLGMNRPVCTYTDDNAAVYYEDTRYALPDGYTTDRIRQAIKGAGIFAVLFDDGAVYYSFDFIRHEELSALGAEGHILELRECRQIQYTLGNDYEKFYTVYEGHEPFLVLMDDNVLYEVLSPAEE